jgi:hypothetical protein
VTTRVQPEILFCHGGPKSRVNGWTFPRRVERELRSLTAGRSVLHLFGGIAPWGIRLDIDPATRPSVIGDAWLPPFRRDAVDVVILDPPYTNINLQTKQALLRAAAFVARHQVIWFSTVWIDGDRHCRLERAWLVRVGTSCQVRCLQIFRTADTKPAPWMYFTRGPAIRYNRWIHQGGLPLEHA